MIVISRWPWTDTTIVLVADVTVILLIDPLLAVKVVDASCKSDGRDSENFLIAPVVNCTVVD